jgi:predicted PurR-regulated permease PerM
MALAIFVTLLYLFRHLAILLLFFVTFERAMGFSSRMLAARTGLSRKKSLLLILFVIALGLGAVAWLGIGKTIRTFTAMQEHFPERLAQLREHPLIERVQEQIGGMEKVLESAKHYSGSAISAASAIGHFVVHIVMGFVLALVYVLEEEELQAFYSRVDRRSIGGTLARWFGHVADATVVTVQLQLIVAACNTVMTLPVLILLGVPNIGALMLLIFVSALVPVIGNIVSGVTLSLLAYQQKGWLGVGIFIGLTFVLHKIESYYLNPRLTSRHVKIPGFLLIVSLIACEHLFGFKGLFLSFPILFVVGRIRTDFLEEDSGAASSPIDLSDNPDQIPLSVKAARSTSATMPAAPRELDVGPEHPLELETAPREPAAAETPE